jgi:hypothetical protein
MFVTAWRYICNVVGAASFFAEPRMNSRQHVFIDESRLKGERHGQTDPPNDRFQLSADHDQLRNIRTTG